MPVYRGRRTIRRRRRRQDDPPLPEQRRTGPAVVDCGLYEDGVRRPGEIRMQDAVKIARKSPGAFVWIGLHEPELVDLEAIAQTFDLHPLAVEDAVNAHQRPKLEQYGDTLFLVLKTIVYVDHEALTATSEVVDTGQIMIFAGEHFAVVVRHGSAPPLTEVRKELEANPELLAHGSSAVLHAIADKVVDDYLDVASRVEDDFDDLEADVFSPSRTNEAERIYQLKRELTEFKRAANPLARPLDALVAGRVGAVGQEIRRYLRDVADHLEQVHEQLNAFDALLDSILSASQARISVQQNTDMRKISSVAAILAVPTMFVGVYGMNFDHMPELRWTYGYPAVMVVIVVACGLLFRAFRRNGWL